MRLTDAQDVPLSSLGDCKLLALSRHWGRIGVIAMRRFLATLPEILRRGLFRRCGCQSVFEYATKFSSATREVVNDVLNVYRQIGSYPELWSLFVEGKIGLTALRRIAPRVRPDTVDWWAGIARTCTLKEIEALIKASEPPQGPPGSAALLTLAPPQAQVAGPNSRTVAKQAPGPSIVRPACLFEEAATPAAPATLDNQMASPNESLRSQATGCPTPGAVHLTPLAARVLDSLKRLEDAGIEVVGYVATGNGSHQEDQIKGQIAQWKNWYGRKASRDNRYLSPNARW